MVEIRSKNICIATIVHYPRVAAGIKKNAMIVRENFSNLARLIIRENFGDLGNLIAAVGNFLV
jgi:hypothetical protein